MFIYVDEECLDPYLGDDPKTAEFFNEEAALTYLLADEVLFANSRQYSHYGHYPGSKPEELEPETIVLFVVCNDVFYWACADAESITMDEVKGLYEMWLKDRKFGPVKWCCLKRRMRPQKPFEKMMRKEGSWDEELESLPERVDEK